MTRRKLFAFALFAAALGFTASLPTVSTAQPKADAPIKIGMVKTFFTDLPDGLIKLVTDPFPALMKNVAGLDGELSFKDDAFGTADKLDAGKLDLGVFHGHELAWLQQKYPKMKPLMVVANNKHDVRAIVVVSMNSPAGKLADLRGKTIAVHAQSKEHCRVFLGKECSDNAQGNWHSFFKKVEKSDTPTDALNDVARGKVDAAVVDTIGLDFYKDIKGPAFNKHLRILAQSEAFPSAVIVYKDGAIPPATLKKFCDGLLTATKNPDAAPLLKLWNIDGFELPPANYAQHLADCLKAYPAPMNALKLGMR